MTKSNMVVRNILAAAIIALGTASLSPGPAQASNESIMYFWEDERTYGWSRIPDVRYGNPAPRQFSHRLSLTEQCARMVGRLLLRDRSGLVYATQLGDTCVRNGGRI